MIINFENDTTDDISDFVFCHSTYGFIFFIEELFHADYADIKLLSAESALSP